MKRSGNGNLADAKNVMKTDILRLLVAWISPLSSVALAIGLYWTYSHPQRVEVVGCPCKAVPPPEYKLTEQQVAGETEEIFYKKTIGGAGNTLVMLHNGTAILLEGIISMETRKTACIQYWTAVPPAVGFKRALSVAGQPTTHWIIE